LCTVCIFFKHFVLYICKWINWNEEYSMLHLCLQVKAVYALVLPVRNIPHIVIILCIGICKRLYKYVVQCNHHWPLSFTGGRARLLPHQALPKRFGLLVLLTHLSKKLQVCDRWLKCSLLLQLHLCKMPTFVQWGSCLNLFVIPFYLQSIQVHSENCVKMYTMACRRGLSSPLLYAWKQIKTGLLCKMSE
jgi:hypothetical protein